MARDFSGSGQYINVGQGIYEAASAGKVITIAARLRVDSVASHRTVIGARNSTAGAYFYWNVTTGALFFQPLNGGINFVSSLFTPSTTVDEYWGMEYDRDAGTCSFYRNGSFLNTDTDIGLWDSTTVDYYIGARNNVGTADLLHDGRLSELAIWSAIKGGSVHAALSKGYSPANFPEDGENYWPLIRDLQDVWGGQNGTNVSTTDAAHPRIINPMQQLNGVSIAAISGASLLLLQQSFRQ